MRCSYFFLFAGHAGLGATPAAWSYQQNRVGWQGGQAAVLTELVYELVYDLAVENIDGLDEPVSGAFPFAGVLKAFRCSL